MPYDERFVAPMRAELTRLGVEEMRTPQVVDTRLKDATGTTLVVVNSICGCAARNARPAVAMALRNSTRPEHLTTVFAGQDLEATARAREYFTGYRPSSPQIALLKDGQLVFMLERHQIEGRSAEAIARDLAGAFEEHCQSSAVTGRPESGGALGMTDR
ncbi:MAG TPA: BrxA/BrxB family bacilliredoxin [Gemmatimonadaceae bacterium]|nr:BrxA/BrxB family bacilliredoxin [Gemmatimonadaceae bacterium]